MNRLTDCWKFLMQCTEAFRMAGGSLAQPNRYKNKHTEKLWNYFSNARNLSLTARYFTIFKSSAPVILPPDVAWRQKKMGNFRVLKTSFRISLLFLLGIFIVASVEFAYFYLVFNEEPSVELSDAIIVFNGEIGRVRSGYMLAELGFAPYLIISPADSQLLREYTYRFAENTSVNHIVEDRAMTTFENAFYAQEIIKENEFKSIILVTSTYHLPRALFMLKCLLFLNGIDVKIHNYMPLENPINLKTLLHFSHGRRTVYREMVEFWGSLTELIYLRFTGNLPGDYLRRSKIINKLRKLICL